MKFLIATILIASVCCINAAAVHEEHKHDEKALVIPTLPTLPPIVIPWTLSEKLILEFLENVLHLPKEVAKEIAHVFRHVNLGIVTDLVGIATSLVVDIVNQNWKNLLQHIKELLGLIPEIWRQLDKEEVKELLKFLFFFYLPPSWYGLVDFIECLIKFINYLVGGSKVLSLAVNFDCK